MSIPFAEADASSSTSKTLEAIHSPTWPGSAGLPHEGGDLPVDAVALLHEAAELGHLGVRHLRSLLLLLERVTHAVPAVPVGRGGDAGATSGTGGPGRRTRRRPQPSPRRRRTGGPEETGRRACGGARPRPPSGRTSMRSSVVSTGGSSAWRRGCWGRGTPPRTSPRRSSCPSGARRCRRRRHAAGSCVAAAHTALNVLRSGRRRAARKEAATAAGPADVADVAETVLAREERHQVRQALARLPRKQALVLVLRHSGLAYAEQMCIALFRYDPAFRTVRRQNATADAVVRAARGRPLRCPRLQRLGPSAGSWPSPRWPRCWPARGRPGAPPPAALTCACWSRRRARRPGSAGGTPAPPPPSGGVAPSRAGMTPRSAASARRPGLRDCWRGAHRAVP